MSVFTNIMKKTIPYIIIAILLILLYKSCNEPTPKAKVITKIKTVHDTIIKTKISAPKKVYFTKTIIDTIYENNAPKIVYIKDSVKANEYDTKLESNNASANLKITTTGELLDVKGVITYPEKETIIKEPINTSNLYLSGQSDIEFNQFGVGLDYTIKNKVILGVNALHNLQFDNTTLNFKIGFKL